MSSASGRTLTGDLIEPWMVENPQADPDDTENPREEIYLGGTTDDIEIERDPNDASWPEHMNEQMQRRELQEEAEAALVFTLRTSLDNLLDANLYHENEDMGIYEPTKNVLNDAIEFDIWERSSDDAASQTYRCYDAQPVVETVPMEIEGPVTVESVFWLMGSHGWVVDEEA